VAAPAQDANPAVRHFVPPDVGEHATQLFPQNVSLLQSRQLHELGVEAHGVVASIRQLWAVAQTAQVLPQPMASVQLVQTPIRHSLPAAFEHRPFGSSAGVIGPTFANDGKCSVPLVCVKQLSPM
jgi:hypothetical protein